MQKIPKVLFFLAASISTWLSASIAGAQAVQISIETPKSVFRVGEAIPVVLVIKAPPESSVVFYRAGFDPEPELDQPISRLHFDIVDPRGNKVGRSPSSRHIHSAKPSYCNFLELTPASFFGMQFYINRWPFSYSLEVAGKHKIKAFLQFRAREWLRGFKQDATVDGARKKFSDELLADGLVTSNEIEIEIVGLGPEVKEQKAPENQTSHGG